LQTVVTELSADPVKTCDSTCYWLLTVTSPLLLMCAGINTLQSTM